MFMQPVPSVPDATLPLPNIPAAALEQSVPQSANAGTVNIDACSVSTDTTVPVADIGLSSCDLAPGVARRGLRSRGDVIRASDGTALDLSSGPVWAIAQREWRLLEKSEKAAYIYDWYMSSDRDGSRTAEGMSLDSYMDNRFKRMRTAAGT